MKLLLDKAEAADVLSISICTLNRLVKDGKLTPSRIGARVVFTPEKLQLFVKQLESGEFAEKKRGRPRLAV